MLLKNGALVPLSDTLIYSNPPKDDECFQDGKDDIYPYSQMNPCGCCLIVCVYMYIYIYIHIYIYIYIYTCVCVCSGVYLDLYVLYVIT